MQEHPYRQTSFTASLPETLRASMHAQGLDAETIAQALARFEVGQRAANTRPAARKAPRSTNRKHESPRDPGKLPQHAPGPPTAPRTTREDFARAEHIARASAQRAFPEQPGRVLSFWAPWVRPWVARAVQTQAQCTRELLALPPHIAKALERGAEPWGGRTTHAGRTVIAFGALVYWHARAGYRAISGLSASAWRTLTVGTRKGSKHYSHSMLFHRVHDVNGPLADERGPFGGITGADTNIGLIVVLERMGFVMAFQPDGRANLPAWLVGKSGYAFNQILITVAIDPPSDIPIAEGASAQMLGVRIDAAPG